jgi:streptogramin lyase/two-component sensor histidine kinase
VNALQEDSGGSLWIGTAGGLAILDPTRRRMEFVRHAVGDPTTLGSDDIGEIYKDREGVMWVCTERGLSRELRAGHSGGRRSFRTYLNDPADAHPLGGNIVTDVLESSRSEYRITTYGRGLNRLDPDSTFARFLFPGDSLKDHENYMGSLAQAPDGIVWLSTRAGLVTFDPRSGQMEGYPIDQLVNVHIGGIAVDRDGDLWLSTAIGLAKVSPSTHLFRTYGATDGLPFRELTSGFFRTSEGKLLAGGLDGFTEFSPESVSTTTHPPEIAITSVLIFDKELPPAVRSRGDIRLDHDQNFLSFAFAALDYADPARNRYSYRMVGVDKEWIDAGVRNYATYANLEPGDYVFRVRGCNSASVWNEAGVSLAISISPPYWNTWWFRALAGVLLACALYSVYRYRLHKLLELERLRLRIADDLHDDVGSNLSTIAMVSRALRRTPDLTPAAERKLNEIYDTAIATSESMKDIVWLIKPKDDTLDDLILRMKEMAESLLAEIEHDFRAPDEVPAMPEMRISIDFKRHYFLAFKEILNNIVKHASATRVRIDVQRKNGILETVIHDNGRGFDSGGSAANGRGNGLASLQNRAANIGGVCEIASEPGKGTRIRFSGKL